MLRHLSTNRDDGTRHPRTGECDPSDSIFLVLLWDEHHDVPVPFVASAWLTVGEAQGALNRYASEGHKAHHGWLYGTVQEYQTGQLAPQSERHGEQTRPAQPVAPVVDSAKAEWDRRKEELELQVAKLQAQLGHRATTGG